MQPMVKLMAEEQELSAVLADYLVELSLTDSVGFDSDTLDLTLSNPRGVIARPRRGVRLQCWLGFKTAQGEEQLYYKGAFYVDELTESSAPEQLSIHAKSADMLSSAKVLRTRSFEATTVGEVLETIAAEEGWPLAVAPQFKRLPITWLVQQDESNLALLTRLGTQYGAVATVKNSRLVFVEQGSMSTASGQAMPKLVIKAADCSGWTYQELGRGEYSGAIAQWRDSEGNSGQVQAGTTAVPWVMRTLFDSEAQANEGVQAELKRLKGESNSLSLNLAQANPALCAEAQIEAQGFRAYIDAQPWVAKSVSFTLSASSGLSAAVECVRSS